ncbi:lantibiotic dehydratase [Actinacidiphila sp. bgisy145]|uniref:lantibiotic dehydratase n=1 Tax=Actinacidiphila sp. bgisy145 TaxID=3413792 RepID=UPI003EBE8751
MQTLSANHAVDGRAGATSDSLLLPGSRRRIWPQAMVRSAGYPASAALALADPAVCRAADAVPDVSLSRRIDLASFDPAWREYRRRADRSMAELAGSSWLRLAVTWQNRAVLATGIDPLLAHINEGRGRDAKRRAREATLVTYVQRYCTKNETIGFFGPIAWAGLDPARPAAVAVRPGSGLLSGVDVHMEGWAVDAVAAHFAERFDLRPWLPVRRVPSLRPAADGVRFSSGRVQPADPVTAAVLARADGRMPAWLLAAEVAREHRLDGPEQVMALLAELADRRWLTWDLNLAGPLHTDDELAALAQRITDPVIGGALRSAVGRLVAAKRQVAEDWADPDRLDRALGALDKTFVELSGVDATRRHGKAYSGRTVAYPESRRDVAVDLGGPFVDALAPLGPLADSARWLTWRVRELFLPHVRAAYRKLLARGIDTPDAMALWLACLPLLASALPGALATAREEFDARWRRVLAPEPGQRVLHRTTAQLARGVAAEFAAPRPGWSEARVCCPDLMMIGGAAPGEPFLVLGEMHVALNTLDYQATARQHPDMAALQDMLSADFPEPRLLMALPKDARPRLTPRSHPALVRPADYRLLLNPKHPTPADGVLVAASDAQVHEEDGELVVVLPDGHRFDVMDLFAEQLKEPVSQVFGLLPGARRPRIVVDSMVVARQSWTVPARKAAFAMCGDERERFVAARGWARRLGLPRFVFVKSPLETKPFFVDFDAPAFVEVLARTVRRLMREPGEGDVTVVEMLPEPDQCWLTDRQGRGYTSELRLVLVEEDTAAAS